MTNREKAARAATRGNLFFFACVLLALLAGAFAATADGNKITLILGFSLCGVFLVLGCVLVYLHSRIADKYKALAKAEEEAVAAKEAEEAERNIEAFAEDGLPGLFCREIRGYSPAQLRLILEEQKDEYTEEEYAFIQKVLEEKA